MGKMNDSLQDNKKGSGKNSPRLQKTKHMPENVVLFLFRRDLRIDDNVGLLNALEYCKGHDCRLITAFTFTPEQIDYNRNKYFSHNSVQFMIQSLKELNVSIKSFTHKKGELLYYTGTTEEFLHIIMKSNGVNLKAVFYNSDYTPYGKNRDAQIKQWCDTKHVHCENEQHEDYTLHSVKIIKTGKGNPYKMFTPFYNKIMEDNIVPNEPIDLSDRYSTLFKKNDKALNLKSLYSENQLDELYEYNKHIAVHGGRSKALQKLGNISKGVYNNYVNDRDSPSLKATTQLSAYIKYGCVSIREVYYTIKNKYTKKHSLIRELYWREFYANITYHYSHVLRGMLNKNAGNAPMRLSLERIKDEKNNVYESKIKWRDMSLSSTKHDFKQWCEGKTGFPMVDAGMRQMNVTGFMHNRLRMLTSNFLVKDLHIDWRQGERYFATKLVDYDPASNNGGWQWSASTGTDAQPFFRHFNPWSQIKKHDKECKYIKTWITELKEVPPKHIMKWFSKFPLYTQNSTSHRLNYPEPMLNHKQMTTRAENEIYSVMRKKHTHNGGDDDTNLL